MKKYKKLNLIVIVGAALTAVFALLSSRRFGVSVKPSNGVSPSSSSVIVYPLNPRKPQPDVMFCDLNYYKGIRNAAGGWAVAPGQ